MTFIDWHSDRNNIPAVQDLKAALEAAIDESSASLEIPDEYMFVEGFYDHNVKINKLSHRAINNFNLPILTTWFRYGQCVPYDEIRPSTLEPRPLPGNGNSMSTLDFLDDPPSREKMKNFFLDIGIGEILTEEEMIPFLRDNYRRFAPEEYKQIYLKNLDILEIFEEVKQEENLVEEAGDYYLRIHENGMDLTKLLLNNPTFDEEITDHVERSLHTIEDVFLTVSNKNELSRNQIKTLYESRDLYHEHVWTLPAFAISNDMADGPRNITEGYIKSGQSTLSENIETYPNRTDDYRYRMYEYDLIPKSNDYKRARKDTPSDLVELADASMNSIKNG